MLQLIDSLVALSIPNLSGATLTVLIVLLACVAVEMLRAPVRQAKRGILRQPSPAREPVARASDGTGNRPAAH